MVTYIQNFDTFITKNIYLIQRPILNDIMIFFTHIGDLGIIWILLSLFLLFSKKHRYLGISSAISLIICLLLVNLGLKPLVQRPRPFQEISDIILLIKAPTDYSFPSGHTAASFAVATVFYKRYKKWFFPILFISILISFSRLYLTVHYFSDVLAGAFIGVLSGLLANLIFSLITKKR